MAIGYFVALSMHFYVKPSKRPLPKGTSIFGFQVSRR